jgi:hypothetical protein
MQGCGSHNHSNRGEYDVLGVPHLSSPWSNLHLRVLHRETNNGECLKMAVGHQEFSTSFAHAVNHATEDELEEDLLQQVLATTREEELSPPCLDDFTDYFSLVEEEVEFQDLEQEVSLKPFLSSPNSCHWDCGMSS